MTQAHQLKDAPKLCMAVYERRKVMGAPYANLACTYPEGHEIQDDSKTFAHSWHDLAAADEQYLNPPQVITPEVHQQVYSNPDAIVYDLIEGIRDGEYDDWLEAILSAGHDRKRARRGVRGFRRRDR